MRATYDNNLLASVYLWAENRLGQVLQAYSTLTTQLFYTADLALPAGYTSYSAPVKGWVYDSGVTGVHISNEVSGGGFSTPLTRDSGIHIDYENGRVIVPTSLGTNLTLTGTYSAKEVNIYLPAETEGEILTQNKYFINPRYASALTSGAPPYSYATPAVFINPLSMHDEPFQFGGTVASKTSMTLTVLAETNFQLMAILSLFKDARFNYIPLLTTTNDPIDQWGDVKGGTGYNYLAYVAQYGTPGNLVYVEDVRTAKVSDRLRLNPRQFAGVADLELVYFRQSPLSNNLA